MELTISQLRTVILNLSSEERPIKSVHLFEIYGKEGETLHNFQRRVSLILRELQLVEFTKASNRQPFHFIATCNDGIYIAKTKIGMAKGIRFYAKKTGRRLLFPAMVNAYKIRLKEQAQKDLIDEKGQYEIKLG